MALLFLGKLLIITGIALQAYTLYQDPTTAKEFDTQLTTVLKSCSEYIPKQIQKEILAHLRLVVVGLLGFSVLMLVTKSVLVKIPVLLGLVVVFVLRNYPFGVVPSYKDEVFWGNLAVIGGILYLMGAESCGSCSKKTAANAQPAHEKSGKHKKH